MQILNRLFGLDSNVSRPRREGGSRRRFQPQFSVEGLEDRDLKSNIPGVSLQYGYLSINATQASNNVASVSIDPSNQMVKVSLNGNSVEYNQSDVNTMCYTGSQGGGDTFTNDTSLTEVAYGYGGNNNFVGGTTYNIVFLYGDHNAYDDRNAIGYTFTYGTNNTIPAYGNQQLFEYAGAGAGYYW
jgi:hypothetical protein